MLASYRADALTALSSVKKQPELDKKKRASLVNKALRDAREASIQSIKANVANDSPQVILEKILLSTYANYVVLLETRNKVWEYDYMSFSRRAGELWESLCKLCWDDPAREDVKVIPGPVFEDERKKVIKEVLDYVDELNLPTVEKEKLLGYHAQLLRLGSAARVSLKLDLHYEVQGRKCAVDFKNSFNSNEKGNTERLTTVGEMYQQIGGHELLMLVREEAEGNNHYFQALSNSPLWDVYCGDKAYARIQEDTGFALGEWIRENVNWDEDFSTEMRDFLNAKKLRNYLKW